MAAMNAQELRIGNWVVRNSSGTYQQVKEVFTTGVLLQNEPPLDIRKSMRLPLSAISPIPLTPEILEKCGFEYMDNFICIATSGFVFKRTFGGTGLIFEYEVSASPKSRQVTLTHLHQLQNLYYSLTGDELKIEL